MSATTYSYFAHIRTEVKCHRNQAELTYTTDGVSTNFPYERLAYLPNKDKSIYQVADTGNYALRDGSTDDEIVGLHSSAS
jgi:hypothetical protein